MSTLSEIEEEDRIIGGQEDDKQLAFVTLLKDYPILLNKSQLPAVKLRKENAVTELILKLQDQMLRTFTNATLTKKISRMKTQVKTKCDTNRTGNQKVVLKAWEKIIADLIGEKSNPSIAQVQV